MVTESKAFSAESINSGAPCLACDDGKFVTTHLYVAIVPYASLMDGSYGTTGAVKATHVGIRLPEEHLRNYRAGGFTRDILPALAGDTTALEAWLRRLSNPRPDGSVRGRNGVIPADRVEAVKEDVARAIDQRHDFGLTSRHCRGHELEEVAKVIASQIKAVGAVQLRWSPGMHVRALLTTPDPANQAKPYRSIVVRSESAIPSALRMLMEVK
jgi:hypothetical protein